MLFQLQRNQVIESGTDDNHDELWNEDKQNIFNLYDQKKP